MSTMNALLETMPAASDGGIMFLTLRLDLKLPRRDLQRNKPGRQRRLSKSADPFIYQHECGLGDWQTRSGT